MLYFYYRHIDFYISKPIDDFNLENRKESAADKSLLPRKKMEELLKKMDEYEKEATKLLERFGEVTVESKGDLYCYERRVIAQNGYAISFLAGDCQDCMAIIKGKSVLESMEMEGIYDDEYDDEFDEEFDEEEEVGCWKEDLKALIEEYITED